MQIKQKRTDYWIRCAVVAMGFVFFAPKQGTAQFVGNPLIPVPGKVIIYTNDAKGGHHQVATLADRNNLSPLRRQPGMLCTVMDDGTGKTKTYQLICADVPAELENNANWVLFSSGASAGGNNLIYGVGIPVADTGKTGDFYINTTDQTLFGPKKEDATWPWLLLQGAVTGAAGGALTGTYPNPSIAEKVITAANIKSDAADQVMVSNADGSVAWVDKATLGGGGGNVGAFNGNRPITGDYYKNVNPGTNDLAKWIEAVFYPSLGPSASLTSNPSGTKEMGPAGNTAVTLNWTAGRAMETGELTSINVAGQEVFSSSPAPGATVTGTVNVSATSNQSNTFKLIVKTADNKTAEATASLNFQWKRYYGFANGGEDGENFAPTDAQILALGSSEFGSGAAVSNKAASPSGRQKLVIAYPSIWGGSKIIVGILDSTGAFEKTTRSFRNSVGGVTDYVIFVQRDNTAAGLTFTIQ
ncbi:hypothetical protein H9X96_14925 [Pedobacter sp. N36a]|uniref:hypothetical protein n=1 Tax=Pedobacter sp. N36a TaxID=2767996 RepID=UPI001656F5DE|nr:hypothetical protein [Pedobacter sp. N36a]MBC8987064.1 hypothetical protein [Pedobacter sp. N36a]